MEQGRMNERIRELAEQAELNLELQSLKVEKFAELIVAECMALCKSMDETDTRYRYDYRRGVLDCVDTIKEHFGVE
jgi:hypothetical protein